MNIRSIPLIVLAWSLAAANAAARTPSSELPDLVTKTTPSVVNIKTDAVHVWRGYRPRSFLSVFIEDFFEMERPLGTVSRRYKSEGTGVVIDSAGLVLTNHHIIADAETIQVVIDGGRTFSADVVGKSKKDDLALLSFTPDTLLPAVAFGNSDSVRPGEDVFAIGMPYGYRQSVTRGVVSAVKQEYRRGHTVIFKDLIQTDLAVNPGNSGGPLLNMHGEMIGLITLRDWRAQGIGFAISSNHIQSRLNALKSPSAIEQDLWDFATRYGCWLEQADDDRGERVAIERVVAGSSASTSGLKAGDVVTRIGKDAVSSLEEAVEASRKTACSGTLHVRIERNRRQFFTYLKPRCE